MHLVRPFLWIAVMCVFAIAGCNGISRGETSKQEGIDYSWVASTPWKELPGHYDRGNLFMAKNYYDRQRAYASGEIPPPRLLSDSYSSHPLAYYTLQRDAEQRVAAETKAATPRPVAASETRLAGSSATQHFSRGLAYYDLGDFDGAIKEFTRAIYIDGSNARAYAFRALAYGYMGDSARAQSDLRDAIRLNADPKLIEEVRRALREEA